MTGQKICVIGRSGQPLCWRQPFAGGRAKDWGSAVPESLMVNSGEAFNTGQAVMGQAVELREELDRLGEEWDRLSDGWSGAAASAYTSAWQDWHQGALKLVDSLSDLSEKLCRAAVHYEQQDADAAQAADAAAAQIQP